MADDKEIRIRAVLDASTFDKGVTEIQEKLKRIVQQQQQGAGAQRNLGKDNVLGKYAQQAFGDFSKDSQRQLEQMYQVQRREAVNQQVSMRGKQQELEKMLKIDGDLTKQQSQRVDLLRKEIDLLKEKHRQTLSTASAIKEAIGPDAAGGSGVGGAGGSAKPPDQGFLGKLFKAIPAAALAQTAIMAARAGLDIWREQAEKERNITTARGSAIGSMTDPLRKTMQGRGIENAIFARERRQGQAVMQDEMQSRRARDIAGMAGPNMWNVAAGIGGFALGGPLGAAAGYAGASALQGLGDKNTRGAMFNTEEYRTTMTADAIKKAQATEEAQKMVNYKKTMGTEFFMQEKGNFGQYQQQFGKGNAPSSQFLREMLSAGVPFSDAMQMAGSIQGAGGVGMGNSRADVGDVSKGFGMQQGGFSNVGQMMGVMRGNTKTFGGGQSTEASMKKFFVEAFRAGVDDSKMVEELRVFAGASIALAQSSGMRMDEAAGEIAKGMGGVATGASVSAAKDAFEAARQQSTAGGAALQRKLAYLQTGEGQGVMGGAAGNLLDAVTLSTMDIADISENNTQATQLANKMGVSVPELRKLKQQIDIKGEIAQGGTQEQLATLTQSVQGMTSQEITNAIQPGGEAAGAYAEYANQLAVQSPTFKNMGFAQRRAYILGQITGQQEPAEETLTQEQIDQIPEFLRKPGLAPKGGETVMADLEARGRGLLTTQVKGTEAADYAQNLSNLNTPTEPGGQSPMEMIGEAAKTYDASSAVFRDAVQAFSDAVLAGKTSPEALEAARTGKIAPKATDRFPSALDKIMNPNDYGTAVIEDWINQPNAVSDESKK